VSDYPIAAVRHVGRPTAWWGMLMFVATEATLFGAFVGTYCFLRFKSPAWPQGGLPEPTVVVPLVMAGVLLSSSIPMQLASNAAGAGRLAATRAWILLALVVQAGYFAYEVHDFADQLQVFDITVNAYSSIHYTLLGAAHAHVALGLLFDLWLLAKLVTGLTRYRVRATEAIALYWHAVNVITLVVTLTLVSAAIG
jgi:heme/copper-type cytochrome/quinol oxidase subunit 3